MKSRTEEENEFFQGKMLNLQSELENELAELKAKLEVEAEDARMKLKEREA